MKNLLFFSLFPVGIAFSQASFVSNDLVVSNLERDTVYIKNDPTGRNIYQSWQLQPYHNGKKVVTILVEDLTAYHQRYEMLAEARTTSTDRKRKRSRERK